MRHDCESLSRRTRAALLWPLLALAAVASLQACAPRPSAPASNAAAANSNAPAPAGPATNAAADGQAAALSDDQINAAYSAAFNKCMNEGDAKDGVTVAMLNCSDAELARKNEELNSVYQQLLGKADPARREAIRSTERAWSKSRDKACDAADDEGTAGSLNRYGCLIEATIRQIAALKAEAAKT
ncbi:MAG TPA: lysozyme inhibitor LprI family protein [Caulobacteraceae bacterium]|nr:lysozyme inhibitor LprI family protein [Caulobacteraceae bacterium]